MNDQLQRFMFEAAPVRGEYVSLQTTWQDVLTRRDYPAPVRTVLGQLMAAAALLSANLKFHGALIIQIYGDGPVRMLVVQCNSDLTMRATAKLAENAGVIKADATLTDLVNVHGGGRCAITLDPADKQPGQQPYQGVVPLYDDQGPIEDIAHALEHYMRQSEQLDTRLWLAANSDRAVGMLLQKLPGTGGYQLRASSREDGEPSAPESPPATAEAPDGIDDDTWDRVCALGGTLKADEMLHTESRTLLHRLFWEEPRQAMDQTPTRFACTCSREKVGGMLTMLGREEVESILSETHEVEVICEFCNQRYVFDPVDAAQLFLHPQSQLAAAPGRQQ